MEQSPEAQNIQPAAVRQSSKRTWSIIFLIVAALFVVNGLYTLSSDDRVVGGDAYNYIISASKGTGKICAGVFFALVSVVIAIFDLGDRRRHF